MSDSTGGKFTKGKMVVFQGIICWHEDGCDCIWCKETAKNEDVRVLEPKACVTPQACICTFEEYCECTPDEIEYENYYSPLYGLKELRR